MKPCCFGMAKAVFADKYFLLNVIYKEFSYLHWISRRMGNYTYIIGERSENAEEWWATSELRQMIVNMKKR